MTIPFLSFFKKKAKPAAESAPVPAPLEKPSSDRFSKTVMPNAQRTVTRSQSAAPQAFAPSAAPRTVSFNTPAPRTPDLPPAVSVALEPRVERAVSLELSEVVAHMPPGFVRELEHGEGERPVLLKASELERGMANGRPAVAIATIYEQAPDIFVRPVAPGDPAQVQLPFHRVLEQFTKLQVRADQHREQAVPQVETPFLRVTLEDDTKFGTSIGPVETTEAPPVRLEAATPGIPPVRARAATARTISDAEPEPAAREVYTAVPRAPMRLTPGPEISAKSNGSPAAEPEPAAPAPAVGAPARIPFKLLPKGTDVPGDNKVPASGGPSVPTSSPEPDAATPASAPARIPFKLSPPSSDDSADKEKANAGEPWLTKDSFSADGVMEEAAPEPALPATFRKVETVISLPLHAVMQMLTPFQVIGDANSVPADVRVEIPFALVEPQLATGRVQITPDQFAAALPAAFASMFDSKSTDVPVSLPLQEVLKNLPSASLRMREDQVEQEQGANFATPFSAKAEEDARRFKVAATPVPKPSVVPPPEPAPEPVEAKNEEPTAPRVVKFAIPAELQPDGASANGAAQNGSNGHKPAAVDSLPEEHAAEEEAPELEPVNRTAAVVDAAVKAEALDGKSAVELINALPGITACALMFGDGLALAGDLPEESEADGLCAMAPSLMQRVENHMLETNLGELRAMTLSCSRGSISFLMHENLCLAVLHAKDDLTAEVRERLAHIVHELSEKYSHPA